MTASDKARELGAEEIEKRIEYTVASGFPDSERVIEFLTWLNANGFRGHSPYMGTVFYK
jgi:hypothetical protein